MIKRMIIIFLLVLGVPSHSANFSVDEVEDMVILGAQAQDNIGLLLDWAGDVNADGLDDMMFATEATGGKERRKGYLVFGTTDQPDVQDLYDLPHPLVVVFQKTTRVGGVGDFNGDGYDDVGLADVTRLVSGIEAGITFIAFGQENFPDTGDLTNPDIAGVLIQGRLPGEFLGNEIRSAGDMNGDGFEDLLLSGFSNRGNNLHEVVIIYGGTDVPLILSTGDLGEHGFIIESAFALDGLGDDMAALGDVDGDGFDDVLLGANALWSSSYAYLIFGGTDFPPILNAGDLGDHGIRISASGESFAKAVCAMGDLNGDNLADFAVGEPGRDVSGKTNAGGIHIIFGRTTFPAQINADSLGNWGITIEGTESGQTLGQDLSGGMDFDGDEFLDLATRPTNQRSEVYLIFGDERFERSGKLRLDELNYVSIQKDAHYVHTDFPEAIEFLGDINGDGYDDLAIGDEFGDAYEDTPEERFSSGLIHIILGGPDKFGTATPTPTITPTGTSPIEPTRTPTPTLTPQKTQSYSGWILSGEGEVKKLQD